MAGKDHNPPLISPPSAQGVCPACETKIQLHTASQALIMVCNKCQSAIKIDSGRVVKKLKHPVKSLVPMGVLVELKSIAHKVVGFIKYKEYKAYYYWTEYTLFHPVEGYSFLSEFNGHWIYVKQIVNYPFTSPRNFDFLDTNYNLYNDYRATVVAAVGEFSWNILEAGKTKSYEYLSASDMLIKDVGDNDLVWYRAEHISRQQVHEFFKVDYSKLPAVIGVGVLEPSPVAEDYLLIKKFATMALGALLVLQLFLVNRAQDREVYRSQYNLNSIGTKVTPQFTFSGAPFGRDNVEVNLYSPVDNTWFEASITLVNDQTGDEYFFEQGVEYYYGFDDGNWSEGSTRSSKVLSSIPDGPYHLNVVPYVDKSVVNKPTYFEISVTRSVTNWTNFFLTMAGVLLYPVILYWKMSNFEHNRWLNSKYLEEE